MATYEGSNGQVMLNSVAVAEVRSWTLTHTREVVEDTVMGDSFRTYKKGLQVWTGSMEVVYSDSESGTVELAIDPDTDAAVTVKFFADANNTTNAIWEGGVVVTSFSVSNTFDGLMTATVEFQGTGAPTLTNWKY